MAMPLRLLPSPSGPHPARGLGFLRAAACAALGIAASCGTDNATPGPPKRIEVVAGAAQSASVGTPVAVSPSVRVRDARGRALVGVTVLFTVGDGGGTIGLNQAMTDAQGTAVSGLWTLGTTLGANTLIATVSGTAIRATITATALPGPPFAMEVVGSSNLSALAGSAVAPSPTVLVRDAYGNPIPGLGVRFAVSLGGGEITGDSATTDQGGWATVGSWRLGTVPGINRLTAQTGNGVGVSFEALGLADLPSMTAISPTTQAGYIGFSVPEIPRVRVTDGQGNPLAGVPVRFRVVEGMDARLTDSLVISGADGVAAPAEWKLGTSGSASTVEASLEGLPMAPVAFRTTAMPAPFTIDLRLLGTMTPDERDGFVAAATRWMRVITADIPDASVNAAPGTCADGQSPALHETVDDLVIFASVTQIDGPGNVLASAGPCIRRIGNQLTAVGSMRFDVADLANLETSHRLVAVITHEMGHVLGFGTAWADRGLVTDWGGPDPIYNGTNANLLWPQFNAILGYQGRPIPVENNGGSGTRDVHWRESVLGAELMTGYIAAAGVAMPLSRLTVAALQDLGYTVDYGAADPFAGNLLAGPMTVATPLRIADAIHGATWEVGPDGVLRPIRGQR